jgi:hypothetical protein
MIIRIDRPHPQHRQNPIWLAATGCCEKLRFNLALFAVAGMLT